MTGWLPSAVEELFGADATADESYDLLTVDVPPSSWIAALETARTTLTCTYFDWLSAVDEPGTGFHVSAHVVALAPVRRLLIRTTVPHDAPVLPTAVDVYAGAAWHERETHEMFGVAFEGHPHLVPLLLPDTFEGHPLRKDFVLAARVAKAWPGAKEPGESEHGGPKRRQMLPPGVPDPNEWGPLKGQLPAAPARAARGAARATGDRPVRRARTAGEGSAGQAPAAGPEPTPAPRRSRSASQGSASQRPEGEGPAGAIPAGETPAVPAPETPAVPAPEAEPEAAPGPEVKPEAAPAPEAKSEPSAPASDAPWHQARPAFDASEGASGEASREAAPATEAETGTGTSTDPGAVAAKPEPAKAAESGPAGPESAKPEPAKPESAKSGPAEPEPAKPEPAGPGPAKPESAGPEPAKPESAKSGPAEPEPEAAKSAPAKTESAKPEPTRPDPAEPAPAKPDNEADRQGGSE
ncbi:NADH-quinone oxidoreductase subunit C [Streptomyces sp. NPDC054864]